ncbi:hypothetical protein AAFP35_12960 [Gordonia sp. CPCC 206044]|uniref:hypothetical protein n=1 Tax=Gordonia sp. CPCC 206044 TaxID=3140793 RepID=UPI003AF3529C
MSIETLASLVTPPKAVPTYDFGYIESALGFLLPDDYKQLMTVYGGGTFGGYLNIMEPTVDSLVESGRHLQASLTYRRDLFGDAQWTYPDGSSAPVIIDDADPVPFFGWGGAMNDESGYWHMRGGDPNEWAVAVIADGVNDYDPRGLVAYLTHVIKGEFPTDVFSAEYRLTATFSAYC